jgi:DNA gyrase subunit B
LQNVDFSQEEKIANWCNQLHLSLQQVGSKTEQYKVDVHALEDTTIYIPRITVTQHGMDNYILMNAEFFYSKDYKEMVDLGSKLSSLVEEGAYVQRADKVFVVENFEQALAWLMDEAKKGQTIQRYKGLGEMNPIQLWETTMDPMVRRMLQVTIEDAVAADAIFTTLMGDNVEPRREFIESNALDAENIDI